MKKDKFSMSAPVAVIDAATALAATVTGNVIDTKGFDSLTVALDIAISVGSVDSVKFQESSDDGATDAYVDIQTEETLSYPGSFPVSADGLIHVGCIAKERYVKMVVTCTTPTGTIGALGLLQDSFDKPTVKESSVFADADVRAPGQTADAVTTHPKRV